MDDKWFSFFQPFFAHPEEVKTFIEACEKVQSDSPAKVMMHQTQRLVSLADDLAQLRPGRHALQVLFLLICGEAVAKLQADFQGDGQSRKFVRRFFSRFLSPEDSNVLSSAFQSSKTFEVLSIDEAVDLLYNIRCDVVHEGHYWGFFFLEGDGPMVNPQYNAVARISIGSLRDLVVRACIRATRSRL